MGPMPLSPHVTPPHPGACSPLRPLLLLGVAQGTASPGSNHELPRSQFLPPPPPASHPTVLHTQVTQAIASPGSNDELLELLRNALGVRLGALALTRGESSRHKLLLVDGLQPEAVYRKLKGALMPVNRRRPR